MLNNNVERKRIEGVNIIRSRARGDVFLVEPILTQLGQKYRVNLTTHYPNIFSAKDAFTVNRKGEYDITINLDNVYERHPKQHVLISYINEVKKWIDVDIDFRAPSIQFLDHEKQLISNLRKEPFVIINIDPKNEYQNTRRVFGLNIHEMANEIKKKHDLNVIECGLYNTYGLPKVTVQNEREVMMLIAASSFFIGLDSFFLHIAGALKKKGVGFFGSVNPKFRLFDDAQIAIFQNKCEYQHCYHNGYHYGDKKCELNLDIPKCAIHNTNDVMDKINQMLSKLPH